MGTTELAFNLLNTLPTFFSSCLILSFKHLINWQNSLQSNLCFGRTCARFIYNCPISKHQIYFHCCFCYREIFTRQRLRFFWTLFSRKTIKLVNLKNYNNCHHWVQSEYLCTLFTCTSGYSSNILNLGCRGSERAFSQRLLKHLQFKSQPTDLPPYLLWASHPKPYIHPNLSPKAKTTL